MTGRRVWVAAAAALLGTIGCVAGLVLDPAGLARAWLVATEVLLGLPLGAAAILLLHGLTGGRWGEAIRPQLRAQLALLPLALVLMVPLLAAIPLIFPFIGLPHETLPVNVVRKLPYLAPSWIIVRTILEGALLMAVGWLAARPDRPPGRVAAAVGLLIYAAALTLFTTDWGQALEPAFTSTIYAMMVAGEQVLGALAAATVWHFLCRGARNEPGGTAQAKLSGDLAKLLITGILGWVYLAYMQWLIIWIGNLPGEIEWYLRRGEPVWEALFWLAFLGFAGLPFLALLLRAVRNDARRVTGAALLVVAGYVCMSTWRLAPAFALSFTLPFALIGVGGLGGLVLLLAPVRRAQPAEAGHG